MKKENSGKKSLLWLWITIGAVVALVVAGVLCYTLGVFDGSKKAEEKLTSKIYWNLDGQSLIDPTTGLSNREASDDGYTYIRFAVGGEVVELPVADRTLVHKIDLKQYCCLKLDADGVIIDAIDVEELYVKIADRVYVQQVNGNTIQTNSSMALNGMSVMVQTDENTGIYNVTDKTEKPGYPGALEDMDQIIVFGTDENTATDIFITDRYWYSEVYWRVSDRMYNSTAKLSTRERAEDGYWYMDWSVNGETITLRTNKQDVVNAWDGYSVNAACCGMVFDENGDVIDCFNAAYAVRGYRAANGYDVTALAEDGSSFTATRILYGSEVGKTYTSIIDESTKIFNVNSTAEVIGEFTELQLNDRVLVFADPMGKAKVIYVFNRMVDSPMYYNVSRKYSTGLMQTTRTPDADGWYNITLAVKGKQVTYRTKDINLVNQIDRYSTKLFGLKVENGVILDVYDPVCVAGNYSFAANYFVDSVDGVILATTSTSGTAANGVLADNCEIYDVSGHGEYIGVPTTIRAGDRVVCYQNPAGEITYVYIINRYEEGSVLYWNVNRYYSGGASTRGAKTYNGEPLLDEDGYYHFRVIKVGTTEVTWVKTKDVDIVNRMDSYGTPPAFSLYVNSAGVVTGAYPACAASGGYITSNYLHVYKTIEDETAVKYGVMAYNTGATGTLTLADNVAVYDFTSDSVLQGEAVPTGGTVKGSRTTLRIGDKVSCIANREGKVEIIFVIERETSGTQLAVRKSGSSSKPAEDGYYYFDLFIDGQIKTVKTNDEATAKKVTSFSYAFAVKLSGDTIVGVYNATASPDVYTMASGAYYDVVKIEGGKLYLKRNRVGQTDTGKETSLALASDYVAYNIDATSPDYCKKITLSAGDRIYGYTNYDNELAIIYVAYECTREGGNMGYCEHCGQIVHWEATTMGYAPAATCIPEVAHYYVPNDYSRASAISFYHENQKDADGAIIASTEIVLDLNGKTMTRRGTVSEADGVAYASSGLVAVNNGNTLIITDYSKAGTGKLVAEEGIVYSSYTGLAQCSAGSTLIIEKGLLDASGATCNDTKANGGTVVVGGELIVNGGTIKGFKEHNGYGGTAIGSWGNTSITINGGTIIGGHADAMGGTISANGDLTINGGKIYGGTSAVGDNIRFNKGNLTITGGEIDGGIHISSAASITLSGKPVIAAGTNYGLKLGSAKIDASGLKAGASVYVDASGVFTNDLESAAAAQALIDNGALKAGAEGMMLKVEGKAVASVSDGKIRDWTDSTKLPDSGRWKLTVDVNVTSRTTVSGELYIDLNGHDITRTVDADSLTAPQVYNTGSGKLTIDDTSAAADGTVSIVPPEDTAIKTYSAVIQVAANGEFTLQGGIIDASNVDNTYNSAANGAVCVGGKLTVNGGTIKGYKRGSGAGGAIGAWAGSEIIINGGKIVAGGSFLNESTGKQLVNGGAIATTGTLTINGGEIVGPGEDATTDEQKVRSGGLIYANGDSLIINGGSFYDGRGTGYGLNIYYERNYKAPADADGNRAQITGGGEVIIGGDAYINGGVTIRSSVSSDPVKLTVKDTAVIDSTGAISATNIRLYNGELYLNEDTTAITAAPVDENYDISIVYTCKNVPKSFSAGNATKYEHNYGDDTVCDDCSYDKNAPVEWTETDSLPTSGNYILAVNVETSVATNLTSDLYLDLNGKTITHKGTAQVIKTGTNKLTITDTSEDKDGLITSHTMTTNANAFIYVAPGGELVLEAGTIDGSNITSTYTTAAAGTITIANGMVNGEACYASATINGGKVIGWNSTGNGGAIGMMNLTSLTVNGGEIVGGTLTKHASVNNTGRGAAIMANGHVTITGGKIYGGSAEAGGDNIFANNANAVLTITGGEIDGGVQLYKYSASSKISGNVTIAEGTNYGLLIPAGSTIDLTGLTGGEIYIDADGVFTTEFESADAANTVLALLKSGDSGKKLAVEGTAIQAVSLVEISLSKTELELTVGDTETITATVNPAETTVTWSSSDETVATVVDGAITAVKAGTATITATGVYNGITVTETCAVTVNVPASDLPIEEQAWVEWEDGTMLPTEGKYKLTVPVSTSTKTILTGELWLDLNGKTVTFTGTAEAINTRGNKLVIDDLSGKTGNELGCIKSTVASTTSSSAVIYINAVANGSGGELVLNNGIIDGSATTSTYSAAACGAVTVGNNTNAYSSFIMNGGVIKGQMSSNTSSGKGGSAVGMMNSTTFVMNGGEIYAYNYTDLTTSVCATGTCINAATATITINNGTLYAGRAINHGAAIYTTGSLYINGGTIYGGYSNGSGAICSNGNYEMTVTGGMIVGGYTKNDPGNGSAIDKAKGTLTIGGSAVIGGGITVRGGAKLVFTGTPIVDSALGAEQKYDVRISTGSVYLDSTENTAISTTDGTYKVTYDTATGKVNGLAEYAAITYTEAATLPTSGAVKLTDHVTLTETLTTEGALYIDLNGKTVTYTGTSHAICANHNIVITDTSAEQTGKIENTTATISTASAILYTGKGVKAVLVAGTLDGSAVTSSYTGGFGATVLANNYASFIMLGGEIKGQVSTATTTGYGGSCVAGWGNSTICIYGGTLTAAYKGDSYPDDAVAVQGTCISSNGVVFVHGGVLNGTMARNHGANIYCAGNLTITGGLIMGGRSSHSGLINCSGATCTITGGTLVGGYASSSSAMGGASIDKAKGTLIIGGNAKIAGGVSIRGGATLILKDKAVIDMTMEGQTQQLFNLQIKSGDCFIYLNDTTGTALASASSGQWDVTYDNSGYITGITAK